MAAKTKTIIFFLMFSFIANAQKAKNAVDYKDVYFGFGAGLDYGGFGCKIEFLPAKQTGFFLGGGYNLNGLSYNVGTSIRLTPNERQSPKLIAVYGYNAVVDYYNLIKTYYGTTLGIGYDYEVGKNHNKFSVALLFPFFQTNPLRRI